ncbi:type-F conjugative transfer system secretin TraK [Sphingobium baderi]|uniref:type-F conjugative transfer system secretin TraK n=1 Tax=Sphingobium baderi TaxID=1332080 RepID=UPI002B40B854|nr:type-F conjugative transfer system secretin TraK [Sphingobium baderi]WRD78832.1 type-F conjugative transfer system secretin TraK [Sphingobium baderi]
MMAIVLLAGAATGLAFLTRTQCIASRLVGASLLALVFIVGSTPALADQTIMAADSAQVDCHASARDLTRISLVDDAFASVSKISTGNPGDDFSVVNEPVRGDIYLSVPDGYGRTALSFFGTSKRGYVYKFLCRIGGGQAEQVFVSNPAIASADAESTGAAPTPQDAAVALIEAMAGNRMADGYEMRQRSLRPVRVGDLTVQMIAEYRGSALSGRILRIENRGDKPVELDSATLAPSQALAVSIAQARLEPGKATSAFLVTHNGRP